MGLGAEGVRLTETCYFCILLTQNQVTRSAKRIILVFCSPRANRYQECNRERDLLPKAFSHVQRRQWRGSGEAVGLKTGTLVSTISLQETFTPAQRSTACILPLTCQQPLPSAFFLSFPPALSFLLPFLPPSILPCCLPTGRQELSTVGRRCPIFIPPPGDLPPQQPLSLTSEAARRLLSPQGS